MRACLAFAVLALTMAAVLSGGGRGTAASFTVDRFDDAVDAVPGDGACEAEGGGCTLRAAVQEANALPGPDVVQLLPGTYQLSIAGAEEDAAAEGDLDVTGDLTVNGGGAATTIIDAGALSRVFDLDPLLAGIDVTLSGVTLRNGAAGEGAGIRNRGGLLLSDSAVTGNEASSGGGLVNQAAGTADVLRTVISDNSASVGGGIRNNGVLVLTESALSENSAADDGGGVVNFGDMTVAASELTGNTSGDNGGAYWGDGTLNAIESSIAGNTAADEGGGILSFGGQVIVSRSTLSDNTAQSAGGGGVQNFARSTLSLTNVTVSGNAAGSIGGGIANQGSLTATHVTVAFNSAATGGGLQNGGTANLRGSILAGNANGDCAGPNAITSLGANVDGGATCGFGTAGDQSNVDPQLGPLQDNGGPARTHALPASSPAVDIGGAGCPPPASDERGVARPQGAACDAGAFELESATPPPTPTPSAPAGDAGCDGAVNAIDAALILQAVAGLIAAVPCPDAADVNGDTLVNAVDAALVLQIAAGLLG